MIDILLHLIDVHEESESCSNYKVVHCEKCLAEYVYLANRTVKGKAYGIVFINDAEKQEVATKRARENLLIKLQKAVELVPCPNCGYYQENMQKKARRLHLRWLQTTGSCLVLGLIPIFLISFVVIFAKDVPVMPIELFLTIFGVLWAAFFSMIFYRYIMAYLHDPNASDENERIRLGRKRGMLRKDFDAMQNAPPQDEPPPAAKPWKQRS